METTKEVDESVDIAIDTQYMQAYEEEKIENQEDK